VNNQNYRRRQTDRISIFSIGGKLVIIVTLIVLVSLSSIIALVSWLIREDIKITAEENNFEMNRRLATEVEDSLLKMKADTLFLGQMVFSTGQREPSPELINMFFDNNEYTAALYYTQNAGGASSRQRDRLLTNTRFFRSRGINPSLARSYFDENPTVLRRAASGQTLLLNASPYFTTHILALFFPSDTGAAAIIFTPEKLNVSFGSGANQSYMINASGDILIHSDYELIKSGANVSGSQFIKEIQESKEKSKQELVEADFGFSKPYAKELSPFMRRIDYVLQDVISLFNFVKQKIKPYTDICKNYLNKGKLIIYKILVIDEKQNFKPEAGKANEIEKVRLFAAYTKLNLTGCIVITSIERDKVFEGINATTRRNMYLTGAVLCFSILLIWFFAKTISVPLKMLAGIARKIEGGNFDVELNTKRRDEIGVLTSSFKRMGVALNIFGRFTNKEIAIKAMRNQIKPGGLSKNATIFFSDIRGFTATSEEMTKLFGADASDRIVIWLNNYLSHMVECVEKTKGTIDKFIGDAVMAHWGTAYTTGSPAKDAFSCIHSALMMRKAVHQLNKIRAAGDKSNPTIRIGCGINTGIVTTGQIGSDIRMEYTVIGDPVNLASRIESLTKPLACDILISENTWRLVRKNFITEEMPSVTVKGKEKPLRIFAVVNYEGVTKGPKTLNDVRDCLGIEPPELESVDVNADEKKYKIGAKK
jgi:adenylate cyclase